MVILIVHITLKGPLIISFILFMTKYISMFSHGIMIIEKYYFNVNWIMKKKSANSLSVF